MINAAAKTTPTILNIDNVEESKVCLFKAEYTEKYTTMTTIPMTASRNPPIEDCPLLPILSMDNFLKSIFIN